MSTTTPPSVHAPVPPPSSHSVVPAPGRRRTNPLDIASLVLGLLAAAVPSVVLAIVALVQVRRTGDKGRGLAIGGLVASGG